MEKEKNAKAGKILDKNSDHEPKIVNFQKNAEREKNFSCAKFCILNIFLET